MVSCQPVRPWHLREGIGCLAARARIAGTARCQGEGLQNSSGPGESCNGAAAIEAGTGRLAGHLDWALHGGGAG